MFSGLYYKLHGTHRPVNLSKPTIKRRKRIPPAVLPPTSNSQPTSDKQNMYQQASTGSNSAELAPDDRRNGSPSSDHAEEFSGQPARKKVRKADDERDTLRTSPGYSGHLSSDHTSLPSYRPNDLTLPELAAVAALAMHANHELSLQHSTQLNSELLDHHHHPLHSSSEGRIPSETGPASDKAAQRRWEGSRAHFPGETFGISDQDELTSVRAGLMRECGQARETIDRLRHFISRSEGILGLLDRWSSGGAEQFRFDGTKVKPLVALPSSTVNAHTSAMARPNLDLESSSSSPYPSGITTPLSEQERKRRALEAILTSIPPASAHTSALLRKRKLDKVDQVTRSAPVRMLWEICPSISTGLTLVESGSSTASRPLILAL